MFQEHGLEKSVCASLLNLHSEHICVHLYIYICVKQCPLCVQSPAPSPWVQGYVQLGGRGGSVRCLTDWTNKLRDSYTLFQSHSTWQKGDVVRLLPRGPGNSSGLYIVSPLSFINFDKIALNLTTGNKSLNLKKLLLVYPLSFIIYWKIAVSLKTVLNY